MSVPWTCPICNGGRIVPPEAVSRTSQPAWCHACDGKGVVWEPVERAGCTDPLSQHEHLSLAEERLRHAVPDPTAARMATYCGVPADQFNKEDLLRLLHVVDSRRDP